MTIKKTKRCKDLNKKLEDQVTALRLISPIRFYLSDP